MSDKERVQIGPRIPKNLKKMLDGDERPNHEIIEAALWREYGGKKKRLVETQIERKREQLHSIKEEREGLAEEEQSLESEIMALKERLDTLEGKSDALATDLDDILDRMEDGEHMWPDAGPIEEASAAHGLADTDVLERLKHRAAEQGRAITTHQFHRADLPPEAPDIPVTEVYDGD
jgi:predicted nuclease with TOPRIM domain